MSTKAELLTEVQRLSSVVTAQERELTQLRSTQQSSKTLRVPLKRVGK